MDKTYLKWVIEHTETRWWHDSADPIELKRGLERGAVGVTTNPVLAGAAVKNNRERWATAIERAQAQAATPEQQAEALTLVAASDAAESLLPVYETSRASSGWVCAQVNPARAGDRACMTAMARRFHAWAPNIAVKLPATAAGLDVLEDCVAEGMTCAATVSFTVPQAIAIAERHRRGIARAVENGIQPGRCFAVIMIGRLDDYLREIAHDRRSAATESDICQAGLAVSKRAYSIYKKRGYAAVLLVAALRGSYHLSELAGASLVMSIHPAYQEAFLTEDLAREPRIDSAIADVVLSRLRELPEFVRAYEPDGMTPAEFIEYGLTQRTLSQFSEAGWKQLESCR